MFRVAGLASPKASEIFSCAETDIMEFVQNQIVFSKCPVLMLSIKEHGNEAVNTQILVKTLVSSKQLYLKQFIFRCAVP